MESFGFSETKWKLIKEEGQYDQIQCAQELKITPKYEGLTLTYNMLILLHKLKAKEQCSYHEGDNQITNNLFSLHFIRNLECLVPMFRQKEHQTGMCKLISCKTWSKLSSHSWKPLTWSLLHLRMNLVVRSTTSKRNRQLYSTAYRN